MSENVNSAIAAVDLFCGVGGLTYGLENAGIPVKLGVDLDEKCSFAIENNSSATFLAKDIKSLTASEVSSALDGAEIKVLAGCAPCQPFSTYAQSAKSKRSESSKQDKGSDWRLLLEFGRIIRETEPDIVTMENVPPLCRQAVFKEFLESLQGYWVDWRVVECRKIGLPQTRKRLVLLASRLGPISIPDFDMPQASVRDAIGSLTPIEAGEVDKADPLHRASRLSPVNMKRIMASKPGGTWRDWPQDLRAACHAKDSGATYPSVYGRMSWDEPAPTITTQCFGYGNGRFGHPDQNRAISLREAAMLQGFPRHYKFLERPDTASFSDLGRMIGNAVPVHLGKVIGDVILEHIALNSR